MASLPSPSNLGSRTTLACVLWYTLHPTGWGSWAFAQGLRVLQLKKIPGVDENRTTPHFDFTYFDLYVDFTLNLLDFTLVLLDST